MVILAVDSNRWDLTQLVKYLHQVYPKSEVVMFTDPMDAAKYIRENPIDVLYTEISMLGITGFGLQETLEAVQAAALTVFVTTTELHATQAIKTRATDYILKPVTSQSTRRNHTRTNLLWYNP